MSVVTIRIPPGNIGLDIFCNLIAIFYTPYNMIVKPILPSESDVVSPGEPRDSLFKPSDDNTKRCTYWRNTTGRFCRLLYANDGMNVVWHHDEERHFCVFIMVMQ